MRRSIIGFNLEAKKGVDSAVKYCQAWQHDISKAGAALVMDFTNKKFNITVYNQRREDLNRQTADLNKCIQLLNKKGL